MLVYVASQRILLHDLACRSLHPDMFSNLIRLGGLVREEHRRRARASDGTRTRDFQDRILAAQFVGAAPWPSI